MVPEDSPLSVCAHCVHIAVVIWPWGGPGKDHIEVTATYTSLYSTNILNPEDKIVAWNTQLVFLLEIKPNMALSILCLQQYSQAL